MNRVLKAWDRLIEQDPECTFWTFGDWCPEWWAGEPPAKARSSMHLFTKLCAELAFAEMTGGDKAVLWANAQKQIVHRGGLVHHALDASGAKSEHTEAMYRMAEQMATGVLSPWPTEQLSSIDVAKCTFYFQYYKHQAMQTSDYMRELSQWEDMIRIGLSTFAENPEPTRSDCHAWSAHPVVGFYQLIAGIRSAAPGWKKVLIAPNPGELKRFEAKVAHPEGDLIVRFEGGHYDIQSPVPYELRV